MPSGQTSSPSKKTLYRTGHSVFQDADCFLMMKPYFLSNRQALASRDLRKLASTDLLLIVL
jgi:hypothetical protein